MALKTANDKEGKNSEGRYHRHCKNITQEQLRTNK
jgi:hypothetical protein